MLQSIRKIFISRWRRMMKGALALLIFAWMFTLKGGEAAPPDSTIGTYRLLFRGVYSGEGMGVVNANNVMIRGNLVDEGGNRINFAAPALALDGSHFHDEVMVAGRRIRVSGRVDPSGGPLQKARLVCTFTVVGVGNG